MKKIYNLLVLMHLIAFQLIVTSPKKFLVFGGKTGWIGQQLVTLLEQQGHTPICATSRLENREHIIAEIESTKPDFIINTAGITGRPNVDWCEDHKEETMRVNIIGTLNLIDIAHIKNIHITNISTGCIYQYDEAHPLGSGIGFTEYDEPNFTGSFYSLTKILLEKLVVQYPRVLHLRIRMPISDDLNPRGFIGKLIQYPKLINIPNTVSILHDLLPIIIEMTEKEFTGIYNCVNPGTLSHNEIMELYKKYINPNHVYENFSLDDQAKILKAGRSNCQLDASKLLQHFPDILDAKQSIITVFERMGKK